MSTKFQYEERLSFRFEGKIKRTIDVDMCDEVREFDLGYNDTANFMLIRSEIKPVKNDKEKQKNCKKIGQRTHFIYISIIIVLVGLILFLAIPDIINWIGIIVSLVGLIATLYFGFKGTEN
ncbi:MAG: hypothetical protein FWD66_10385 [Paludibacter sp.]|nr:hypothetical protein [Paludibacter sp.]